MPEDGVQSRGKSLAVASYNKDYLTDFVVSSSGGRINGKDYFRPIQNSRQENADQLSETYTDAKAILVSLSDASNSEESKDGLIQIIALPYMRNLLLAQNTEESKQELAELLTLLMPTNPIDLDVLVDAYVASKNYLTQDQQTDYLRYFSALYSAQTEEIKSGFPEAKERFENAQTNDEKYGAIISGKRLERMSKSLAYSNKKLNLNRSME